MRRANTKKTYNSIEELLAICDRFKAQLEQRQKVNEKLVKGLETEVLDGI